VKRIVYFVFLLLFFSFGFSYALRPGDTIGIDVFGQPEFSKTLTIAPNGTISYPYVGTIRAAGSTVDQVKATIEQALKRFFKDPVVTVYVLKYSPVYVYLQGAINKSLDISQLPDLTLTKLFSHLGVTVNSEIDFTKVAVVRSGKSTTYNLLPFFYGEYLANDPVLSEGDIVYLPILPKDKVVQISGAYTLVAPYEPGLTLRALLLKLGPLDKEIAQLESSLLVVDSKSTYVNLEDVIYGKTNYELKPGATLYIPKRDERYVYVIGYVSNPGLQKFLSNEEITLSLSIVKAGGIEKNTEKWIEKIVITTPDGKMQEYTKDILSKANEIKLVTGSSIEVRKYPEFKVYLTGDFNVQGQSIENLTSQNQIIFEPDEPKTLQQLLIKIGGLKTDQIKWVESIKLNGKTVDLSKLSETKLSNNDVVEIRKYPELKVYITGDFATETQVTLEPDEPKTLQQLFVKIGGLKTDQLKWIESVKLNGQKVELSKLETYTLKDKDIVEIKKYPEFRVYLTGDFNVQGQSTEDLTSQNQIIFEPDEPKTLQQLLIKIGGLKTDQIKWVESIKLNGKTVDLSKLSETKLSNNDVVEIRKYPELKVYITGDFATETQVTLEPDEPKTLQQLFVKIGGLKTDQLKWIESVKLNGQKVELSKLGTYTLKDKDIVEIKKYPEFRVYLTGDLQTGVVSFDPDEPRTLSGLLTKIGGIKTDVMKWIESIKINGQNADLAKLSDTKLNNNDVVEIKKYPEFKVYLTGDFTTISQVTLEPDEPKTLQQLFVKIGGLKTDQLKWIESVKLNGQKVELSKLGTYTLKDKDIVEIKKYPEFRVYLTGDLQTGVVSFDPDEPRTLSGLLTKIGGIKTDVMKWIESIKINGQNADLAKLSDTKLNNNDVVEIKKYPEFKVYLTGDFTTISQVTLEPDEPKTLQQLFVKIGGLKTDQVKWIESVKLNGQKVELSKLETYMLKDKDVVEIKKYPEFYVYVQGSANVRGKIQFEPEEKRTLKTLIAKIGLPNEDIENEGKAIINNNATVELKDVIYGTKDYELSIGDLVQITYEPFIVQLIGSNIGTMQLSYKEPRTLPYLIKKLGIAQPEAIEKIILIRDGKQFEYDAVSLIYDKTQVQLNKYDTIVLKQSEANAIYVTGDVAAYVTFGYNEPITLQKVFAKIGLGDTRRIEKITTEATQLDFTKDIPIQKGTILNLELKKPIFVTAMGYLRNTGRVSFDYYETPDLKTLFAKLGGLVITPESYYSSDKVYIIRDGKIAEQYNAIDIFKGMQNAVLKDGDFVYVTETQPKQVYVFGKGMPNGLIRFTQSEDFDLRTLIGKLGGIKDGISKKITIIDGEDVKTITWTEYTNTPLKTNATVLFDVDTESYIYVIDQTGKPNMIYTDRPITLYEVLTKIGTNKNYKKLELTSGTQKQTIELKDISQARSYNVKSGDVVKILDAPENFAYVLGEVNRPGIITLTENTTVLQAIIQAGYFSAKAVPSSVWLYKGGVNGKPIKVNLAPAVSGGNIEYNPVLEPGDVVFVPADMFKTALEWIPIINNLIGFYNNVTGLFK